MACRPDSSKPETLTQKDLDELLYNLAHLSVNAVRRFHERAHQDCRMIYGRLLPSPKQMQTLVQVWKQLWKWRQNTRIFRIGTIWRIAFCRFRTTLSGTQRQTGDLGTPGSGFPNNTGSLQNTETMEDVRCPYCVDGKLMANCDGVFIVCGAAIPLLPTVPTMSARARVVNH
ncbi:MAG TPA: hypothetical protein VMG82_09735 [Candidatus Sulfotelmatobacter sp.]|nr:hypothetical protein [Candidatus Sulfotelmatobacter sp.]